MLDKKRCPFPTRSPMLATTTTPFASKSPFFSGLHSGPGHLLSWLLHFGVFEKCATIQREYLHFAICPLHTLFSDVCCPPHNTPPQVCSSCQSVFVLADLLLCIWDPFGCDISPQHVSAVHVSTLPQHFPYCNMRGQH